MAWDPNVYNQFKSERAAPFFDLLALVKAADKMKVIDLGCGTGELTKTLGEKFPGADVTGIDFSAEMLAGAADWENDRLHYKVRTIEEQLQSGDTWDLVFSNAAIQWVDDHETLFPRIIQSVSKGGQLAIQMPAQHHNITNIILNDLADEIPFKQSLKDFKRISPVLDIDRYAEILFEGGATSITAFEKIYPLILPDVNALYNWVSGTALIPFMERLNEGEKEIFIARYKERLREQFPKTPVFYPFKRIVLHAVIG
jgi:trans-aconitate 2-methyltransferase